MGKLLRLSLFLLTLVLSSLLLTKAILANEDNIFGLHLSQVSDIEKAKDVINSGGGDWGWATIVIRTDQLDYSSWQEFFNNCRKYHIIPIIRLGTIMENGYWKRPDESDIDNLANFLNSLNWPNKDQHIILFNEVNHATEWGGEVDIKNYADTAIYTFEKFKSLNPNFVILSGAFDLAAPEKMPDYKSAENVYREIFQYRPQYFDSFDALSSHSYPNHGFVGTPNDKGQHSIHGFLWEQNFIKSLGVTKDYPVFITETGWPHREGETNHNGFYTANTTSRFLSDALTIWSQYPQIKAVTPFIYNYPYEPFDHFSWLNKNGQLYPEYELLINLSKNKNHPEQITKYELLRVQLPYIIFPNQEYKGSVILKNTGQSVWGETNFCFKPEASSNVTLSEICTDNKLIYPNQLSFFPFKFKIDSKTPAEKTTIGWENLSSQEITPFAEGASIYHPKRNLKEIMFEILGIFFD